MTTVIYGLDDPETQELRYVGQTRHSLPQRLKAHLSDRCRCHRTNWIKSLKTRGLTPGIFDIETISDDQADEAEKFWISYFKYIGADLTNGTEGGEGGRQTPEVRAKIGTANRGRKISAEHRAKIGAANHVRKHSSETRAKLSMAHRGNKNPNYGKKATIETRTKISAAKLGKHPSAETRAKMSQSHLGKKNPPPNAQWRAKQSAAHRGKHHSSETRAKISAANRRRRRQCNPEQIPLL